jgi:hypothetical protein
MGGVTAKFSKLTTSLKAGAIFLRLLMMKSKANPLPDNIRLAPSY